MSLVCLRSVDDPDKPDNPKAEKPTEVYCKCTTNLGQIFVPSEFHSVVHNPAPPPSSLFNASGAMER